MTDDNKANVNECKTKETTALFRTSLHSITFSQNSTVHMLF